MFRKIPEDPERYPRLLCKNSGIGPQLVDQKSYCQKAVISEEELLRLEKKNGSVHVPFAHVRYRETLIDGVEVVGASYPNQEMESLLVLFILVLLFSYFFSCYVDHARCLLLEHMCNPPLV